MGRYELGRGDLGWGDLGQAHDGNSVFSVAAFAGSEYGPCASPRATPLRGGDTDLDAATSGTGTEPASPLASVVPARVDVCDVREAFRSPVPALDTVETWRRTVAHPEGTFGPILGLSIGVAVRAIHDGAAGAGPVRAPSFFASSSARLSAPPTSPPARCGLEEPKAYVFVPGRAGVMLPDRVSNQCQESDGSPGLHTHPPGPAACVKDGTASVSALPDVEAAQEQTHLVSRPGRAGGMLPDRVQHALTQSICSPGAHRQHPGPDAVELAPIALPLTHQAPAAAQAQAKVISRPGRAGGMLPDRVNFGSALVAATARALGTFSDGEAPISDDAASDDDRFGGVATELPGRAGYTAVAAAYTSGTPDTFPEAASTAAIVYGQLLQVNDDRLGWQALMLPDRVGYERFPPRGDGFNDSSGATPDDDACAPGRAADMLPAGAASAMARAVPMDVDQGCPWSFSIPDPLPSPFTQRIGGKRRRLNDVDGGNQREHAEQLLLEDVEAGSLNSVLKPFAASASSASVLSVYAHNAQRFTCTLCAYTASSFALSLIHI